MKKHLFTIFIFIQFFCSNNFAQISPPGLGKANVATWFAFGLRQDLDTAKQWQSVSYVAIGRKSNPDNYNPIYKPAIFVLNQEFYQIFHKNWQYSAALSYRRQDVYANRQPYEKLYPNIQQEFRLYGRLSYAYKAKKLKLVTTFREEFRKFYAPDFSTMSENFQLRSRVREQLTLYLNRRKTRRLIISNEQLFSISKKSATNNWTNFSYKESRFSLYYSLSPKSSPLIFSIGYMNDLVGYRQIYDVHYLAFDVIWENAFKFKHRKKQKINENLE